MKTDSGVDEIDASVIGVGLNIGGGGGVRMPVTNCFWLFRLNVNKFYDDWFPLLVQGLGVRCLRRGS